MVKLGVFRDGVPDQVRYSTSLSALRMQGADETAATLEKLKAEHGSLCAVHGELKDPVIGILGDQVAFVCPWCSGPEILAAWTAEGERS